LAGLELPFSREEMVRLYRFALLLTGDDGRAQQILYDTCAECASRLEGYRSTQGRTACMLGTIRAKAKAAPAGTGGGNGVAGHFAKLPEPERVALAGLYTGLLPAKELAEALKLSLEEMGRVLKAAREHLAGASMEMSEARP